MSNPKIEVDISELFKEIKEELKSTNTYLKKIDEKIDNIDKRLIAVETNQSNIKGYLSDLKGTQNNQIWSLIVILATAILGVLVAGGRILFFAPKA